MDSARPRPGKARKGAVRLDAVAGKVLEPVLEKSGFASAAILAHWADVVGAPLAERTRPERISWPRRGAAGPPPATLVVRAEGADALEIQHMTDRIVDRVNAFLGWPAVGRVRVRQAPVEPAGGVPPDPGEAAPESPVPPADLGGIDDPGLREALARLGRRLGGNTRS